MGKGILKMDRLPYISFDIKDLGCKIASNLLLHHQEIEDYIRGYIEGVCKNLPLILDYKVKEGANKAIELAIKNYFDNEGQDIIDNIVKEETDKLLLSPGIKEMIETNLKARLEEIIKGED
jgi:hypothetical protein